MLNSAPIALKYLPSNPLTLILHNFQIGMILEKRNNQHNGPEKSDKLKGTTAWLVIAVVVLELLIYWYLVFRFPSVMVPVSILLTLVALYFRTRQGAFDSFREELGLSDSDLAWLKKYCTAWVFISLYGLAFSILLIS